MLARSLVLASLVTCLITVAAAAALVSVTVLTPSAPVAAATAPGSSGGRPGDRPDGPPENSARAGRPGGESARGSRFAADSAKLTRIWWNQPRPVEVLGLSDEQRKAMDALLTDRLSQRRELARQSLEIRRTLGGHLAAGDWKAAEKASAELGDRASALARGDVELSLAVVRLLRPEQRRTLDKELPQILRRPWLQGGAGMRPGRLGRPGGERRPSGR